MLGVKTMAGKSKFVVNGSVIELNSNSIELIFSYIFEALMDDPESKKIFISYLERIRHEVGYLNEFLNMNGLSAPGTEGVLEETDQNSDTTSRVPKASHLFLLGKKFISENCKCSNIKAAELLFSYILEALMDTPQGKERTLSCLQRISQEKYLNPNGATILNAEMVLEDKAHNCDSTKALCQKPPTHAASASSNRTKPKVIKSTDNIKNINVRELVYSYNWDAIRDTPQGEKRFLSRLQRISREAKEEYLNIKAANTPKDEGLLLQDNVQYCDTEASSHAVSASSTSRKSKASFEDVCECLVPKYKLPEGLLLAQSIYCAKTALAFYNNKHGTEYKLVEPLSSARHMDRGVRFHCNFAAAKLNKNVGRTSKPKLFYADFQCFRKKVYKMHCCIIDSAKATFMCCGEYCSPDIAHCDKRSTRYLPCYDRCVPPKEYKAKKNWFCAKTALDFYNAKHGTTYKLVESSESNIVPISFGIYKFNCNFKAKLEENPCSSNDASSKLFSGELVCSNHSKDGDCWILDSLHDCA